MSIMGMREWFRKNRASMLVVFVLLLVGLLISYGRFGSSPTYTAADYEKMLTDAREAYAADPESPENVFYMYQVLNSYAVFLNESHQEPEQAKAMSNEAITYYDMYYGMLADEAKDTYQASPNYANASVVANYLSQRVQAQSLSESMDPAAMQAEVNNWMVIALGHRLDEVNAELANTPNDSALLADLADATSALAYYKHEQDNTFDQNPAYQESLALYQQAIANKPADIDLTNLAGYYSSAAACAYELKDYDQAQQLYLQAVEVCGGALEPAALAELYTNAAVCANAQDDKAAAEGFYQQAVAAAPGDYNANMNYASFLLNAARYDEAIAVFTAYRDTFDKNSEEYQTAQEHLDYIQSIKDMMESPEPENDGEGETANNEGQPEATN